MNFTVASSSYRRTFRKNLLLQAYCFLFCCFLVYTGIFTPDRSNWVLENILTASFLVILVTFYRYYTFSDLSYTLMFLFLLLHVYGSQFSYEHNPAGYWVEEQFNLERNHYDRVVHFMFGLLMTYPAWEILKYWFKVKPTLAWLWPVELVLSLSCLYELVEWLVADYFSPKHGPAYLGMQGDQWDAQKDIALAVAGAAFAILATFISHKKRNKRN